MVIVIGCQVWFGIFGFLKISNPILENEYESITILGLEVAVIKKEFSVIFQSPLFTTVPPPTLDNIVDALCVIVKPDCFGMTKIIWPFDGEDLVSEIFTTKSLETPAVKKTTLSISTVGVKSGKHPKGELIFKISFIQPVTLVVIIIFVPIGMPVISFVVTVPEEAEILAVFGLEIDTL